MNTCAWADGSPYLKKYHDTSWCVPVHDDRTLFQLLVMESMSCGLSWDLILKKEEILRQCFADFDYDAVAAFSDADVDRILGTDGMIRSERKIRAMIRNARAFQQVRAEHGSFESFLWSFTAGRIYVYRSHMHGVMEASNPLSEQVSRALKKYGFSFVGPVIVYSYLQACGLINDHDPHCPRFRALIDSADREVRLMDTLPPAENETTPRTCEYSCGIVLFTVKNGEVRYMITTSRKGTIGMPKGHMQALETEEEAAVRETLEETGIHATLIPGFRMVEERPLPQKEHTIKRITFFLGYFDHQQIHVQQEELQDAKLETYEEAMASLPTGRLKEIFAAGAKAAEVYLASKL